MNQKRIGEILLDNNLITQQQLDEALDMQRLFPDRTLGQLLCKLGFLQESELVHIIEQYGKRQRLSDILLLKQLINNEQLAAAMDYSKNKQIPLRRALVKMEFLDEVVLTKLIADQFDLSFVHIDSTSIEPDLANCINASYARKNKIVPIFKIGNSLTLAMEYPLKLQELKDLESSIRLKIIPVVALEADILLAQRHLYKTEPEEPTASQELEALSLAPDSIGDMLKTGDLNEPEIEEETRKVTERDSIIVKLVNKIIYDAYQSKASDIHIEPYPGKEDVVIRMRIDGQCRTYQKIPYKYKYAIPSRIKIMAQLDISERRRPQDGRINFKKFGPLDIELRVATMPTTGVLEDVVIRILNNGTAVPFHRLGLTAANNQKFAEAIKNPYGLILVVGPTGSGKTTTLHAAVGMINTPDIKVWTVEDPVEITQRGLRQVQANPRIGITFASVLRSFLRLDPDVILVGEMRDEETAAIAVEASLTGHLVLSTLHTNSAAETVTRLLDMGLNPYSFADSLICILAQRLARTLCSDCKITHVPGPEELAGIIDEYGREAFDAAGIDLGSVTLARGRGCEKCGHSGYRGRIGIHELLQSDEIIRETIKKRGDSTTIRRHAMDGGMTTLKQDGILKVLQGLTDMAEIRRVCIK